MSESVRGTIFVCVTVTVAAAGSGCADGAGDVPALTTGLAGAPPIMPGTGTFGEAVCWKGDAAAGGSEVCRGVWGTVGYAPSMVIPMLAMRFVFTLSAPP